MTTSPGVRSPAAGRTQRASMPALRTFSARVWPLVTTKKAARSPMIRAQATGERVGSEGHAVRIPGDEVQAGCGYQPVRVATDTRATQCRLALGLKSGAELFLCPALRIAPVHVADEQHAAARNPRGEDAVAGGAPVPRRSTSRWVLNGRSRSYSRVFGSWPGRGALSRTAAAAALILRFCAGLRRFGSVFTSMVLGVPSSSNTVTSPMRRQLLEGHAGSRTSRRPVPA